MSGRMSGHNSPENRHREQTLATRGASATAVLALEAGQTPRVGLRATPESAPGHCSLAQLKRFALDPARPKRPRTSPAAISSAHPLHAPNPTVHLAFSPL